MSDLLQVILTAVATGASTWAAMRVEIAWIKRDLLQRDDREAATELRLRSVELNLAKMGNDHD